MFPWFEFKSSVEKIVVCFNIIFLFDVSACAEAYSESSNQYACNVGCSNQVPSPIQEPDDVS